MDNIVVNLKRHIRRKRIQVFCLNSIKEYLKNTDVLLHVNFSESYKNANQDEIRSAYFEQFSFLFFLLLHGQMGKFAPYQSLLQLNQMSIHVSLLYHAYMKLLVILRKRLELLRNCTYGVMDVHHSSDRDLFSCFGAISTLKKKLNGTLTTHITAAKDRWRWYNQK